MMNYKGYLAQIEFDDEMEIFHGEVINIRDVITFQGQSVAELRQAFQDSIEDYFDFCAERDETPESPVAGILTIRFSPEQQQRILQAANSSGKAFSDWIAHSLIVQADQTLNTTTQS